MPNKKELAALLHDASPEVRDYLLNASPKVRNYLVDHLIKPKRKRGQPRIEDWERIQQLGSTAHRVWSVKNEEVGKVELAVKQVAGELKSAEKRPRSVPEVWKAWAFAQEHPEVMEWGEEKLSLMP